MPENTPLNTLPDLKYRQQYEKIMKKGLFRPNSQYHSCETKPSFFCQVWPVVLLL